MPAKKLTYEDYLAKLEAKGLRIKPQGTFNGSTVKIRHKFIECGHVKTIAPGYALRRKPGEECPRCSREASDAKRMVDWYSVQKTLRDRYGNKIQLVGQYKGTGKRHRFRCNLCHKTWTEVMHRVLYKKTDCTGCSDNRGKQGRKYKIKEVTIGGTKFFVQGYEPQAIEWILSRQPKLDPTDILTDHSGEVPTVRYKIGRRYRSYFPDIYIPRLNMIVEVKSVYTLGLISGKGWRKNQQKAKATIEAGYKFTLLIMNEKGKRLCPLPKEWYRKSRVECLSYVAFRSGDMVPDNMKYTPT